MGEKREMEKEKKPNKENRRKEFKKPIGPGVMDLDVIKSPNEKNLKRKYKTGHGQDEPHLIRLD